MKISKRWLFMGLSLLILVSFSKMEKYPFLSVQEVAGLQKGDIAWNSGVIEVKDEDYRADFGILNVPENRGKADSQPNSYLNRSCLHCSR